MPSDLLWFRRFVRCALVLLASSATLSGCFLEFPKGAEPLEVIVTNGDGQYAPQGIDLAQPLTVQVVDGEDGNPVSGVAVDFSPSHGGRVDSPRVLTDSSGQVSVRWTLGPELGEQRMEMSIDGRILAAARSTALKQWPARALYILQGALQKHYVTDCFPPDVVVLVSNGWGDPLPGVSVSFEPTPDGAAVPTVAVSDAQGLARTRWEVPQSPGDHRLTAKVVDPMGVGQALEAVALTTCVPLFVPPTVTVLSGAGQTVLQHTMMPEPIVLEVRDAHGLPAANYWVRFSLRQGSDYPTLRTDANGIVRWAGYVHGTGDIAIVASIEPSYGTTISIPLHVVANGDLYDGRYNAAIINSGAQEQRYLLSFSVRNGSVTEFSVAGGFPFGSQLVSSRVSVPEALFEMVLEDSRGRRTYVQGRLVFRSDGVAAVFGWAGGSAWPGYGSGWMFDAGRF